MQLTLSLCAALNVLSLASAPAPENDGEPSAYEQASVTHEQEVLALAEEWVGTWNEKDADAMDRLHADGMTYGIFGSFITGQNLMEGIRKSNFFGLSWSISMVDPRVRMLSDDIALVTFRLEGDEISSKGTRDYKSLFTMIFQKREAQWKIVHVHDSDGAV